MIAAVDPSQPEENPQRREGPKAQIKPADSMRYRYRVALTTLVGTGVLMATWLSQDKTAEVSTMKKEKPTQSPKENAEANRDIVGAKHVSMLEKIQSSSIPARSEMSFEEKAKEYGLTLREAEYQREVKLNTPWPWFDPTEKEGQTDFQWEAIPTTPVYVEATRLRKEYAAWKEKSHGIDPIAKSLNPSFWDGYSEWLKNKK